MTEGNIGKEILKFAFPLFLGNLFQQLYNIVDSLVVGNILGKEALAAVSSSGSLIFLLVGFVQGIFSGAGVVISRYYGAKDKERVESAVHTTVAFGFVMGIVLTVAGVLLTPVLLRLMGTPADVINDSVLYFRVYFYGALGIVMYNTTSGIFQAIGDSRHPLYYLIVSAVTNVVLDILFVKYLSMGIMGAALATGISQFLSAILGFVKLLRIQDMARLRISKIRIKGNVLKEILHMGIPSGIQNSVISIANVVVQSSINAFGSLAMAGCGSYSKLEGFAFLPVISFSMALTTFVGQNLGAKEYERVKKGSRFGILAGVLLAELIGIILFIFAPQLVALFNRDAQVIAYGVQQSRTEALFFCLLSLSHCLAGVLRGAGKSRVPMFVMLIYWCVIRIIYIKTVTYFIPKIGVIFWAYPLTWFLSSVTFLYYYYRKDWQHGFGNESDKSGVLQ